MSMAEITWPSMLCSNVYTWSQRARLCVEVRTGKEVSLRYITQVGRWRTGLGSYKIEVADHVEIQPPPGHTLGWGVGRSQGASWYLAYTNECTVHNVGEG